jgi:hypothetical protein
METSRIVVLIINTSFVSSGVIGVKGVISPQGGLGVKSDTMVYVERIHFTDYRLNSSNS